MTNRLTSFSISKWLTLLLLIVILPGCGGGGGGSEDPPPEFPDGWVFIDGNEPEGINFNPDEKGKRPALTIFNNRLYAIWQETCLGTYQIRVASSALTNPGVWVLENKACNQANSINFDARQDAVFPELIVFNNKLFAAWHEATDNGWKLRLSVRSSPGKWQQISTPLIEEKDARCTIDRVVSLHVFKEHLIIAYIDRQADASAIKVLAMTQDINDKFTFVEWSNDTLNDNPGVFQWLPNIEIHDDELYLTWIESEFDQSNCDEIFGQVRVSKLVEVSSDLKWTSVLSAKNNKDHLLFTQSLYPELLTFKGRLYLAWIENNSGVGQARLARQSLGDITDWQVIGSAKLGLNLNPGNNANRTTIHETPEGMMMAWEERNGEANQVIAALINPDLYDDNQQAGIDYIIGESKSLNYNAEKNACRPKIVSSNDKTFITFQEQNNGVWQVRVLSR